MNIKKGFGLSKTAQSILSLIIYVLFFIFMTELIIAEPNLSVRIIYLIMLIFFGFFALYYEFLKRLYNKATFDLLLVYYFSLFQAYGQLEDLEKTKEFYHHIMHLRDKKMGIKKINPLFSWDEITALYMYFLGQYKNSKKSLQMIHIENMNTREQVHYHMLAARIDYQLKNFKVAKNLLSKC